MDVPRIVARLGQPGAANLARARRGRALPYAKGARVPDADVLCGARHDSARFGQ
jgi:hypothetical protein